MYNMYFGDSDKRRVIKLIIEDKQIMIIINKIKSHIHVAIPNIVSAIILIYSVTCLINVLVGTHEILHYLFGTQTAVMNLLHINAQCHNDKK